MKETEVKTMAAPYNHREVEKKWQNYWAENETFKTDV